MHLIRSLILLCTIFITHISLASIAIPSAQPVRIQRLNDAEQQLITQISPQKIKHETPDSLQKMQEKLLAIQAKNPTPLIANTIAEYLKLIAAAREESDSASTSSSDSEAEHGEVPRTPFVSFESDDDVSDNEVSEIIELTDSQQTLGQKRNNYATVLPRKALLLLAGGSVIGISSYLAYKYYYYRSL